MRGAETMSVSGLAPFDRKGHQRRVVVDMLRRVGTAARSEIAAVTGLAPQTVTLLVEELVRDRMVRIVGRRASARGQPPVDLTLDLEGGFAVGIQVEAGRLTGIVTDIASHVRAEAAFECSTASPAAALGSVRALIARLTEMAGIHASRLWGVGIVLPGPFGPVELLEADPLSMPAWSRSRFREDYAKALGLPVFIGNDATAAAIGEHLNGEASDLRSFVYIYLSEGIGGGLFIDGQPVLGAFGNAGEIGRLHVPGPDGHASLEEVASISALRKSLAQAGHGAAAEAGIGQLLALDARIGEAWLARSAEALRCAVANLENLLDPEAVVIGGPVPRPIMERLVEAISPLLPSVSQRHDRGGRRRLIIGDGHMSPALGGATLPLFSRLTPQPRPARPARSVRPRSRPAAEPAAAPALSAQALAASPALRAHPAGGAA